MTAKMLMSLKEKVENHPLVFYLTTFFAGVALATGTLAPILVDQQHSATAKLDAQLATRQQQSEAKISDPRIPTSHGSTALGTIPNRSTAPSKTLCSSAALTASDGAVSRSRCSAGR